jgi:hypothetical protein
MITNKRLNQYRNDLEHASTDAKEQLQAVLTTYLQQTPNVRADDIKQYTLDAIKDVLGVFGDEACMLANEFLEEVAYVAGKDVTTQIYDTFNEKKAEVHVSWLADTYFLNDMNAYLAHAGDSAAFYVKREAFENMQQNCNSNKARWARVPSGRETCGFCFMLASRGFDYHSKKSAGGDGHQFHRHCDCLIVPSFSAKDQDGQVQGYKPTKLYERYSKCEKAAQGGLNGWDNTQFLSDVKAGLCKADEWEKWKLKRICTEIETRDANWLWTGEYPKIDDTEKAITKLTKDEKTAVFTLRRNGIEVKTKAEDPKAVKNIDFEIDGQLWEHKNVTNLSSVSNQIGRSRAKFYALDIRPIRHIITLNKCTTDKKEILGKIQNKLKKNEEVIIVNEGLISRIKK